MTSTSKPKGPPQSYYESVGDIDPSHGEAAAVNGSGAPAKESRLPNQPVPHGTGPEPFLRYDLDSLYFKGPETGGGAYASICVLDPAITIERHHGKYHVAARFNIETTILRYGAHSDNHEWFFQDICLQYLNSTKYEDLVMNPQSDSVAALSVSRQTNTTTTGSAGLSGSGIPSANVSLGLSRSNQLTVEYSVKTWSLSAHHIPSKKKRLSLRPKGKAEYLKTLLGTELPDDYQLPRTGEHASRKFRKLYGKQKPRYQWFWSGNQNDTELLTPDLKHTVKRHVAVKRVIPIELFPTQRVQYAKAMQAVANSEAILESEGPLIPAEDLVKTYRLTMSDAKHSEQQKRELLTQLQQNVERSRKMAQRAREELAAYNANNIRSLKLEKILNFSFFIQIRIKKRYGRLHRLFLFSSNQVKGSTLRPTYSEEFHLRIDPESPGGLGGPGSTNGAAIPLQDTEDVTAILDDVKEKYEGKWYELQDRNVVEIVPSMGIRRQERALGRRMETTRDRQIERELEKARAREAREREHEFKVWLDGGKAPQEFVRTTEGRQYRDDRDFEEAMRRREQHRYERRAAQEEFHERTAPEIIIQGTRR